VAVGETVGVVAGPVEHLNAIIKGAGPRFLVELFFNTDDVGHEGDVGDVDERVQLSRSEQMNDQQKDEDEAIIAQKINQVEYSYGSGGGRTRLIRARKVKPRLVETQSSGVGEKVGNDNSDQGC
jgi:hypothetical protein